MTPTFKIMYPCYPLLQSIRQLALFKIFDQLRIFVVPFFSNYLFLYSVAVPLLVFRFSTASYFRRKVSFVVSVERTTVSFHFSFSFAFMKITYTWNADSPVICRYALVRRCTSSQ